MITLDTHTALWLARSPELLSTAAREAIRSARQADGLAISDKSLWEFAFLIQTGKISTGLSLRTFLQEMEEVFVVLPVTAAVAETAVSFSTRYPRDPADRIIGATAKVHGVPLVTKDGLIRQSGEVDCIW